MVMFWSRSDGRASMRFAHSKGTPRRSAISWSCSSLPSGSEPVSWNSRPTNVDLPWSTWPTMTILSCSEGAEEVADCVCVVIVVDLFVPPLGCNLGGRFERLRVLLFVFLAETLQHGKIDQVFFSSAGPLARNDVAKIGEVETFDHQAARLCGSETGDAIRGENQIQVERAGLDLH